MSNCFLSSWWGWGVCLSKNLDSLQKMGSGLVERTKCSIGKRLPTDPLCHSPNATTFRKPSLPHLVVSDLSLLRLLSHSPKSVSPSIFHFVHGFCVIWQVTDQSANSWRTEASSDQPSSLTPISCL